MENSVETYSPNISTVKPKTTQKSSNTWAVKSKTSEMKCRLNKLESVGKKFENK